MTAGEAKGETIQSELVRKASNFKSRERNLEDHNYIMGVIARQ